VRARLKYLATLSLNILSLLLICLTVSLAQYMRYIRKYNQLLPGLLLVFTLNGLIQQAADADADADADAGPDETVGSQPQSLVKDLQAGGFLVYFRHAETDRSQVDSDRDNLGDCSTQRNLSEAGRAQARAIGEAIRSLRIPIGKVITSPYCRCKDTAQLAFGKAEISHDLRFGVGDDAEHTAYLSQALVGMLSTPPVKGTNTMLVSHTANLKEATGIWPKPEGAAYIFKPLQGNTFKYIGRLSIDAWSNLAATL